MSNSLTATFAAGSSEASVEFPVILDDIMERSETFTARLSVPADFSTFLRVINPGSATATITDSTGNVFMLSLNWLTHY